VTWTATPIEFFLARAWSCAWLRRDVPQVRDRSGFVGKLLKLAG
jgi:hypothetical protein